MRFVEKPVLLVTATPVAAKQRAVRRPVIITLAVLEDLLSRALHRVVHVADEWMSRPLPALCLARVSPWLVYVRSSGTPSHDSGVPLGCGMPEPAELDKLPFMP